MNRLHLPLQDDFSIGERVIKAPKALVRIGHSGRWSRAILAVIDTGAPLTIVSPDFAGALGWKQPEDAPLIELGGLGGQPQPGWRAEMDVAFVQSAAQEPTLGLHLQHSVVFVSELVDRGSVLIGQHDALERLRFLQRNQPPFWDFQLSLPDTQEL